MKALTFIGSVSAVLGIPWENIAASGVSEVPLLLLWGGVLLALGRTVRQRRHDEPVTTQPAPRAARRVPPSGVGIEVHP